MPHFLVLYLSQNKPKNKIYPVIEIHLKIKGTNCQANKANVFNANILIPPNMSKIYPVILTEKYQEFLRISLIHYTKTTLFSPNK